MPEKVSGTSVNVSGTLVKVSGTPIKVSGEASNQVYDISNWDCDDAENIG